MLLVRHGQTPTTGKVLPGGRRACTSPRRAGSRPTRVAERIAALQTDKRKVAAVYASPLERTRETAAPIAKALGLRVRRNQGLLEGDFGEWTGAELKELYKLPEWRTVQRNPSGFRFPGGESFTEMQTRICGAVDRLAPRHPGADGRAPCRTPTRSRRPSPTPWAPTSTCSSGSSCRRARCRRSLYGVDGPVVLAVNSTGDLAAARPVMSARSTCPRRTCSPPARSASPGQRVFYLQARDGELVVTVRCEKQQVAALAEYFAGLLDDLEPTPYGDRRRRPRPRRAVRGDLDRRPHRRRLRRARRSHRRRARGARRPRTRRSDEASRLQRAGPPHPGQVRRSSATPRAGRGRPAAVPVLRLPARPRRATPAPG